MKWGWLIAGAALGLAACGTNESDKSAAKVDHEVQPKASQDPTPVSLVLNVSTKQEGGRVFVAATTNLPDGAQMMATLRRDQKPFPYIAQDSATVLRGDIAFGPFGDSGGKRGEGRLDRGIYELSISAPLSQVQPPDVQAMIGKDYERFRSPHLKASEQGVSLSYQTMVDVSN